jgi:hypothetical protein
MYQKFTLIILCFASVFTAKAQISITSTTFTYVENFNSLVNSGTSSALPTGWAFNETGTSGNTTFTAGTGSSNSGDTYSFGLTSNSERALGSIRSGSVASTYGVGFVYNGTEGRLASMSITYTGETWRTGVTTSRTDKLDFQYSTTATSITSGTWIDFDALDYVGPASAAIASGSMLSSASISGTITGLYIPIGGQIWFRFVDSDATGSDDGLAVDDFTVAPVTLPVEISFFDVISNSRNKNTLNWQTASEKDNAYFEVQHATNGIDFQSLTQVKGNGTTTAVSNYAYEHADPSVGMHYYRLRQVDANGAATFSKVVSVLSGKKTALSVYPTLATNELHVLTNLDKETDFTIVNVFGQIVLSGRVNQSADISIGALTSGHYIVRLANETARFVKN